MIWDEKLGVLWWPYITAGWATLSIRRLDKESAPCLEFLILATNIWLLYLILSYYYFAVAAIDGTVLSSNQCWFLFLFLLLLLLLVGPAYRLWSIVKNRGGLAGEFKFDSLIQTCRSPKHRAHSLMTITAHFADSPFNMF